MCCQHVRSALSVPEKINDTKHFVVRLCQIIDFSNGTLCQLLTTTVENVMKWEELQCNAAFVNHLILIFSVAKSEINASGSRDKESFMCSLSNSLTLSLMNVV